MLVVSELLRENDKTAFIRQIFVFANVEVRKIAGGTHFLGEELEAGVTKHIPAQVEHLKTFVDFDELRQGADTLVVYFIAHQR